MTTIVQLSDTHLLADGALAYGVVDTTAALVRAVAHIHDLHDRLDGIDAVVVSGDLTDLGEPAAYETFRAITRDLPAPIFVIPGNHDDRSAMREALAGACGLPQEGTLDFDADVGGLRLIGLDTTVPGANHGSVSPAQCGWLADRLAEATGQPAILFLHHPPFLTGIGHMDAQSLRAPEALAQIVAANPNVALVACGHVHRAISTIWAGRPCMVAPAPAHAVRFDLRPDAPACFDLEPGAVLVHRLMQTGMVSYASPTGAAEGPFPFWP